MTCSLLLHDWFTFLKKINDLQNQGHVTPKFNFPSWNHGKSYSTMLPVSNDTKFMLVTRNANDFLLEDISNLTNAPVCSLCEMNRLTNRRR